MHFIGRLPMSQLDMTFHQIKAHQTNGREQNDACWHDVLTQGRSDPPSS